MKFPPPVSFQQSPVEPSDANKTGRGWLWLGRAVILALPWMPLVLLDLALHWRSEGLFLGAVVVTVALVAMMIVGSFKKDRSIPPSEEY